MVEVSSAQVAGLDWKVCPPGSPGTLLKHRRPAGEQWSHFEVFKAWTGLHLLGGPVPSMSEKDHKKRTGLRVLGGPVSLTSETSRKKRTGLHLLGGPVSLPSERFEEMQRPVSTFSVDRSKDEIQRKF